MVGRAAGANAPRLQWPTNGWVLFLGFIPLGALALNNRIAREGWPETPIPRFYTPMEGPESRHTARHTRRACGLTVDQSGRRAAGPGPYGQKLAMWFHRP